MPSINPREKSSFCNIEYGRVLSVDTENYTCVVQSITSNRTLEHLGIASPYAHQMAGEGMYCLPEPGALCLTCVPSDNGLPFIMGFIQDVESGPSYRGRRELLEPGDMATVTHKGAKIIGRRGGVIEVHSTPLAQSFYIPTNNLIKHIFQNQQNICVGGDGEWKVDSLFPEERGAAVMYRMRLREYAEDPTYTVRVQLGRHRRTTMPDNVTNPVVSVQVGMGAVLYNLQIDAFGNRNTEGTSENKVLNTTYDLKARLDMTISTDANYSLTILGERAVNVVGSALLESQQDIIERCVNKVVEAVTIRLGSENAKDPIVRGKAFLKWALTHTHGTGPTTTPLPPGIISSKVFVSE